MSFSKDIVRFRIKVNKGGRNFVRRVGIAAYQQITNLTPVDTGRAKANWFPGLNFVDETATEDVGLDSARGMAQFANAKPGDELNISNSLPYIKSLELGSSNQAASGMVRMTALKLKQEIESGKYND